MRSGTLKDDNFILDHFSSPDDYIHFVMDYGEEVEMAIKLRKYLFE